MSTGILLLGRRYERPYSEMIRYGDACLIDLEGLNHFYYDFIQAAFVPTSESALDTSYFTSRYSWNTSDDPNYPGSELEDSSDDSLSGSSSCLSNRHDEVVLLLLFYF